MGESRHRSGRRPKHPVPLTPGAARHPSVQVAAGEDESEGARDPEERRRQAPDVRRVAAYSP